MDERIKTLAKNLVNYSCRVKAGDKVCLLYTSKEGVNMQAGNGIDLVLLVQILWLSVCCAGLVICRIRSGKKEN